MVRPPSPPADGPRRDSGPRNDPGPLLVAIGVVVVLALDGPSLDDQLRVLIPLSAVLGGLALLLRDLAAERRTPWLGPPDRPARRDPDPRTAPHRRLDPRAAIGLLAIVGAIVRLLNNGASFPEETSAVVAALALFAGAVLIAMPYVLRVVRELAAERAERVRAQQFTEVAAHMHDSVLHTLALIQRADPAEVRGLARAQERELRAWLYDRKGPETKPASLIAAVQAAAAEVEDQYRVRIDVVAVGDAELDDSLAACVAAAREALVNAAKYAENAPISVFAEVFAEGDARRVEVFVRDRGPGFELDAVGADRMGIRESIIGRMARHGGRAEVRTAAGNGTEIRLEMASG